MPELWNPENTEGTAIEVDLPQNNQTAHPLDAHRGIIWLVVGHAALGLVGICFSDIYRSGITLRVAAFVGLVSAQTSLLGIRHLVILTFVVACLVSLERMVQPIESRSDVFVGILQLAGLLGLVGVLAVWIMFATKWPVLHGLGLVAVATGAGCWFGWRVAYHLVVVMASPYDTWTDS